MRKIKKNNFYFLVLFIFLFIFIFLGLSLSVKKISAEVQFNPDNIISDAEILDYSAMSLKDIQKFLESKNSFLASYSCLDAFGVIRKASEIIYNAAAQNYDCSGVNGLSENPTETERAMYCRKISINPKFLLVLLQKEQSLIENSSPRQSQLDWATGYGCPDGASCNNRWKGFGKQVNSAALQFYDYMTRPQYYTYKTGETYTFTNPYSTTYQGTLVVTPMNQATAALYNYTPHVYNGNFNFWKIWNRWFTRDYLDGSLLQVNGENDVWLIQYGKKRLFKSRSVLMSRFDINKIITVNKSYLEKYETGAPITFPQYSLVRAPNGLIYLLVDDKRRAIVGKDTFRKIGFNPDEVISGTWEDLIGYTEGPVINASSTYPMGILAQNKRTGGIYWIIENTKAPLIDRIFLTTKFKGKKPIKLTDTQLASYKTVPPVLFDDGELLKSSKYPTVYVIAGGAKRPFTSGEDFEKLGYKWKNIIIVPTKILDLYPDGTPIKVNEPQITLITPVNSSSTEQIISTSTVQIDSNATSSTSTLF